MRRNEATSTAEKQVMDDQSQRFKSMFIRGFLFTCVFISVGVGIGMAFSYMYDHMRLVFYPVVLMLVAALVATMFAALELDDGD
jgi:hypothetical protein